MVKSHIDNFQTNAMASIPLYRTVDIRRIESEAAAQPLMQRAGQAAAELAMAICRDHHAPVLILAGPGNNGGDAFEVALLLRQRFFATTVVFAGDAGKLPTDAADAYRRFSSAGGTTLPSIPADSETDFWSLIVDGLFGIGLTRDISGPYAELITRANALAAHHQCPLLALDCPSGLDADTGCIHGTSIRASHTITFIGAKPGLFTANGPDCCGEITVSRLDLSPELVIKEHGRTVTPELFGAQLCPRLRNSHKGHHGNAGIIGGAPGMVGAAILAARAALRLGSGRVYVGLLDAQAPALDIQQPELMFRTTNDLVAGQLTVLACGPGMGTGDDARRLLESASKLALPLVLDADALNLIATDHSTQTALSTRTAPTLLTPHPAEAARLLNSSVAAIQADRLSHALTLAKRCNAFVALKGCGTLIVSPDQQWFVNTSGNPGLATAGSGDVLTGIITALLAQGWPPLEALLAAVHLHGHAADDLVAQGQGPIGLTAGELIDSARAGLNRWISPR